MQKGTALYSCLGVDTGACTVQVSRLALDVCLLQSSTVFWISNPQRLMNHFVKWFSSNASAKTSKRQTAASHVLSRSKCLKCLPAPQTNCTAISWWSAASVSLARRMTNSLSSQTRAKGRQLGSEVVSLSLCISCCQTSRMLTLPSLTCKDLFRLKPLKDVI